MESNTDAKTNPGADTGEAPAAPITYTFDGRAFVVQPVFKGDGAASISDDRKQILAQFADLATSHGDPAAGRAALTGEMGRRALPGGAVRRPCRRYRAARPRRRSLPRQTG